MRTTRILSLASAAAALALAACAAHRTGAPDSRPIAKDPVCQYYRDLGCVDVRVDADTPRAEYAGVSYYFCCAHCKEQFEANPTQFIPR
jgi:YHS domain-containing protein